ncbi:MAG: Nramp family divalent metal transporter [Chloroflexi bacterium]|nr:Nramp family divalent metal transporter [Chloroflexota bacterium]
MTLKERLLHVGRRLFLYLSILGPGLITASADNDAPGIATYSMAGSHYGYGFLWVILAVTFGEMVVQEMAARMGAVTGKGLADLIRERFGVRVVFFAMVCLLIANLGTTTAEIAGIAASAELLGLSRYIAVPIAAIFIFVVVTRGTYQRVEKVLLALCLYSVAYIGSAFLSRPPWGEVLRQTVVPNFHLETHYIVALLATVGTTITPWGCVYLQASVAEKGINSKDYHYTRLDVISGAIFGNIVSAFIIICTAATLFIHGIQVETAEQAAVALAPLAGQWAQLLFSLGLLGASLLAASVLPLSTAYAICEAFGWERGINTEFREAPLFYSLYAGMLILGGIVVLLPGIQLFPLMWLSQTLNAILLPVILVLMLRLANDRGLMGRWVNSRPTNALAWVTTVLIALVTVVLFVLQM